MRFGKLVTPIAALAIMASAAFAQPSTVILVRHAEKATAPASDPVLSPAGEQRALDLARTLAGARVTTIITTQFKRTQMTAKPLADSANLTPIVIAASGDPKVHATAIAAKVRSSPRGSTVLVVGHSNTVPAIIAALGGPKLADICDAVYSNLFVLELPSTGQPKLIKAKYGGADGPEVENCPPAMRQP